MSDMEFSDDNRTRRRHVMRANAQIQPYFAQVLDFASPLYLLGRQPFVYYKRETQRSDYAETKSNIFSNTLKELNSQRPLSATINYAKSRKNDYYAPDITGELAASLRFNKTLDKYLGESRFLQYTYVRQYYAFEQRIDGIQRRTYRGAPPASHRELGALIERFGE